MIFPKDIQFRYPNCFRKRQTPKEKNPPNADNPSIDSHKILKPGSFEYNCVGYFIEVIQWGNIHGRVRPQSP